VICAEVALKWLAMTNLIFDMTVMVAGPLRLGIFARLQLGQILLHMQPFPRPIGRRIFNSCIENDLDLILISPATGCLLISPGVCDIYRLWRLRNTHLVCVSPAISWEHPPHASLSSHSLVYSVYLVDTDGQHEHRPGPRYLQHHV